MCAERERGSPKKERKGRRRERGIKKERRTGKGDGEEGRVRRQRGRDVGEMEMECLHGQCIQPFKVIAAKCKRINTAAVRAKARNSLASALPLFQWPARSQ